MSKKKKIVQLIIGMKKKCFIQNFTNLNLMILAKMNLYL